MKKFLVIVASCLIAACSQSTMVHAKPSAPVSIEYEVPKDMAVGEVITTTVRFKAAKYLQQLVVSFAPHGGLTVESGIEQQVFTNIESGDVREVQVSIRLDEALGYVALAAQTTEVNGRIRHKNKVIKYGDSGEKTSQTKTSTDSHSEQLILMPAEVD